MSTTTVMTPTGQLTKHLVMYEFNMSLIDNTQSTLGSDADGHLYDAQVRSAMVRFTGGEETNRLEAAAAVRAACHAVERLRSRGAGGRGLSSGALDLLIRLQSSTEEGISIGNLAESIGVTPRNVTGLVDTLEGAGLVRRVPNPADRRSVFVQTLPAGREWLESFRRCGRRVWTRSRRSGMSEFRSPDGPSAGAWARRGNFNPPLESAFAC